MRAPQQSHELPRVLVPRGTERVTHLVDDITNGRAYRFHVEWRILQTLLDLQQSTSSTFVGTGFRSGPLSTNSTPTRLFRFQNSQIRLPSRYTSKKYKISAIAIILYRVLFLSGYSVLANISIFIDEISLDLLSGLRIYKQSHKQ